MKLVKNENDKNKEEISDKEAQEAFIKILKWIGEDPSREGLLETPKIFQYKVIVNTIWHQLLELLMLHIFQIKEL